MKLKIFGHLTDIFDASEMHISLEGAGTVRELNKLLCTRFPALKNTIYIVVLDGEKAAEEDVINELMQEVALLPPYSGG